MNQALFKQLTDSLQDAPGFDEAAFTAVHAAGESITSVRINPLRNHPLSILSGNPRPVPWTGFGYYLTERPSFTFDPAFHAGAYYVQEASSMFLEQALSQTTDLHQPLKVLDLCAAPGGKSTHLQSLISADSLLVSNEVIRSRAHVLQDNMIKWGSKNVVVTQNDPKDFHELNGYFDIIVIDAPCSGSGLFRRDPEAMEEWSLQNVQLCSRRQQRIIADVWPALKPGGSLVYSTCSYSVEEDEALVHWIGEQFQAKQRQLTTDASWGIVNAAGACRFWSDKVKGEGLFMACFQKEGSETEVNRRTRRKPVFLSRKEEELIAPWMHTDGLVFLKHEQTVYAWPQLLVEDFTFLLDRLRVLYSGTVAGELVRDKLVPAHALALSPALGAAVGDTALSREQAIAYLQRKEFEAANAGKGWGTVSFDGHKLGWINALPNRINNYYPKEMRIIKDN